MSIHLTNAELVFSHDAFGFEEVLMSFAEAERVVIVTYSLSFIGSAELLGKLRKLPSTVKTTLVTSVPSRWDHYRNQEFANRAKHAIDQYLTALDPGKFACAFEPWFCFQNHAKVIATESIAYIGSQNFTDTSHGNFECGVIIRGRESVTSVVDPIVRTLCAASERYFGHKREKFLVLLKSAGLAVSGFIEQIDRWMSPVMTYGGDYEDQLDFSLVAAYPILPESLGALMDDINTLLEELADFETLNPAIESMPPEVLDAITDLANSDELANFWAHDSSRFIENKLAVDAPAPEDMEVWTSQVSDDEFEHRRKLDVYALPAIEQLAKALPKLIGPLRDLYAAVRDAPAGGTIDNTAS